MPLGLIKLSRITFWGIFVTVCLLIILLLSKQTAQTKKKLTKQQKKKSKNGPKTNPTFFILHRSLLKIFLLSNKKSNQKIQVCLISVLKARNFFQ